MLCLTSISSLSFNPKKGHLVSIAKGSIEVVISTVNRSDKLKLDEDIICKMRISYVALSRICVCHLSDGILTNVSLTIGGMGA